MTKLQIKINLVETKYHITVYIQNRMPSTSFVKINGRGFIPSTRQGAKSYTVGGAVPLLLNKIIRKPEIKGGSLDGKICANTPVGIITQTPAIVYRGGELLNGLNQISFDKNVKQNKRDNIKFIF